MRGNKKQMFDEIFARVANSNKPIQTSLHQLVA